VQRVLRGAGYGTHPDVARFRAQGAAGLHSDHLDRRADVPSVVS
jgi:hypothetical protein